MKFTLPEINKAPEKWMVGRQAFHIGLRTSGRYIQMSHEKNPLTFHYTGWLIGILIMVYYNPYITG